MLWLEFLVPALVLLVATPSVAIAYIYAKSSRATWSGTLFGFLLASSGVSLLTALGIFLRDSDLVESHALYFLIWNLSFLILAVASWLAIATGLLAVGSHSIQRVRRPFVLWSGVAYAATVAQALGGKDDLYFPYIGGTYAATSAYLFLSLGFALLVALRGRRRLSAENEDALRRFLLAFPPLCLAFFLDELFRFVPGARPPWPPLLPLAPLALYLFSSAELLKRLRRVGAAASPDSAVAERRATAVARGCGASPLTLRERDVLIALLSGRSNSDIAALLGISENTAKNHIYNIYQKTGVGSRSELLLLADRLTDGSDPMAASAGD